MISSREESVKPPVMGDPLSKVSPNVDLVRSYLRDIGRVPLLSHEQEITLGREVQDLVEIESIEAECLSRNGQKPSIHELSNLTGLNTLQIKKRIKRGKRAKERMVAANLRLVVSVAKKYTKRNMELLDLIQEGTIGLVRGVEKFDPSRGYKFSTYAYWWIRQGITRAIAEKSRTIRLPIHVTEILNKLKKGQRELSQTLGRTPSISELSQFVEISEDEVRGLMANARNPISLESTLGDNNETMLLDLLPFDHNLPEQELEMNCMKSDLEDLLSQLPDIQEQVLKMRFGFNGEEPMTLTGIGRVLGISRDRVRNIQRDGLSGLRRRQDSVDAYIAA